MKTIQLLHAENQGVCMDKRGAIILCLIFLLAWSSKAQLKLPSYFSDNMVVQQNATVPFFGTTAANTAIVIKTSWSTKTYKTTADTNGKWKVNVKTPSYGGPYKITIRSIDDLTLNNVLVGEVWLCSGQSNMEMPLGGWGKVDNFKEEILNADYPKIRFLQVKHQQSEAPMEASGLSDSWQICAASSASAFSATAYFFARKVWKETGIPIGIIHSSWGGTIIEAWTSKESLQTIKQFKLELRSLRSKPAKDSLAVLNALKQTQWDSLLETKEMEKSISWMEESFDDSKWSAIKLPAYWGDEVSSLKDYDGTIWFRKNIKLTEKESNSDMDITYLADDDDQLWVNGSLIGSTRGYNQTSGYMIPSKVLHSGMNQITIKVFDGANQGGVYGDDFYLKTIDRKIPLSGLWKYEKSISLKELPKKPFIYQAQNRPTVLYNAMIHPFLNFPITGVLWYQGESNAERAHQYRELFPLLIKDWRTKFSNDSLPFYFVQLANFKNKTAKPVASSWAELRDAQFQTFNTVANTGMIVTTDIGNPQDIHPKNKQEVGRRLALIALHKKYGNKNVYTGPVFDRYKINNGIVEIIFKKAGANGLKAKDAAAIKGFAIAGVDQHFYWAKAVIKEGKIIVSSPKVPNPKAVRYNWSDNPQGNLCNSAGLPASPFRTDAWKDITANSM